MLPQNGETPCFPPQALKPVLTKAPSQLSWGCNSEGSLHITLVLFPCSPRESLAIGSPSPWDTTMWLCLSTDCNGAPEPWCRGCAGEEGHHWHWGIPRTCPQPLRCNGLGQMPPVRRFGRGDIFKDLSSVLGR